MDKEILTRFTDAVADEKQPEAQQIIKNEILPALNGDWTQAIYTIAGHYNSALPKLAPELKNLIPMLERTPDAMRAHDALLYLAREEKPDLGEQVNSTWHMR